jgi:Staphylococcal nuclease homologue
LPQALCAPPIADASKGLAIPFRFSLRAGSTSAGDGEADFWPRPIERHVGRRHDRASECDRWRHARNTQHAHSVVGHRCARKYSARRGEDSDPYRCGAQAANDLDTFIARRPVSCNPINLDRCGRTVATCSVGGADLGEWLVRNGLAVDWPQYSHGRYDAVQREAEHAGRGIWKGSYVEPWLYRVCVRAGGKPADCSDDANAHP